ncbi:MAG: crossover junction endodeoxyribonuclease RuvC [Kiritimatiellia bacterium]|nr:crossover junction endodeoxyribonuclease RuvC [Kiritimatiellia bacterium]
MPRDVVRVMGVDTALRKSGLAVVEEIGSQVRVLDASVIRCPASWLVTRCLGRLRVEVEDRLAQFQPEALAIEGVFFCRNARTALRLGEARGAVLAAAAHAEVPVFEYEPRLVKKAVVGWGGADKSQMIRMIAARLSLPEDPQEDAADALALALCYLQRRTTRNALGEEHPI